MTLGYYLASAREAQGISIDEASAATRVSAKVIEAFENDDFEAMPPRGYAQNMLAAYANYLGLSQSRAAHLYADGFEAAAAGYRPRSAGDYRRGRPIDVSRSSIVDPNYGRKQSRPRPSVDGRQPTGSQQRVPGRTGSQQRVSGRTGSQQRVRGNAQQRPSVRQRGTLERPGIDDASSPDRVGRYGRTPRESDARKNSDREGRRQVRETRQGRTRANQARAEVARRSQGGRGSHSGSRQQRRPSASQQGFGRGVGLMRDREDARRRQQESPIERLRAFAPIIVIVLIVLIAIFLITSANARSKSTSTVSVQTTTASAVASGDSTATSDARSVTTQTGTTRMVTGTTDAVHYEFTIESGYASDVSVTIDGTSAYSGKVVGPATQSYTASKNASFAFSNAQGVTLTRDGQSVSLSDDGSGTSTYSETLKDKQ